MSKGGLENVVNPYHWQRMDWEFTIGKYELSIRESSAQAFEWLREASKMLSIRTIGNGWTGNSRAENMNCRSVNLMLKRSSV